MHRILKIYFLQLIKNFITKFKRETFLYFLLNLSFLFLCSPLSLYSQDDPIIKEGKKLFNANCAACHKLKKRSIGPALKGVTEKYDKEWLYSWIKNSSAMIKDGDAQAVAIYEEYNKSVMNNFPQLSNQDIDNILAYTDYVPPPTVAAVSNAPIQPVQDNSVSNQLILFALVLIFTILLTMLVLCLIHI